MVGAAGAAADKLHGDAFTVTAPVTFVTLHLKLLVHPFPSYRMLCVFTTVIRLGTYE